jgi:hypothetical protein
MKICNELKISQNQQSYLRNSLSADKLSQIRILATLFSLGTLALLSTSYLFSNVNAIEIKADFNGDGKDDIAIGVPREDVGSIVDAGGVEVLYGSSNGLSAKSPIADQFWTQNSANVNDIAEEGDQFGFSLSSGDFNGDGNDDLAIGTPVENVGGRSKNNPPVTQAGEVQVLYGSSTGLSATSPISDQVWTQNSANVDDVAEEADIFGFSLSSGDFNGDGTDDLAIGARGEDLGSALGAGAVQILYGSSSGLSATSPIADQFWSQDSTDVDDAAEISDFFGQTLSTADFNGDGKDDLATAVTGEDLIIFINSPSVKEAGGVEILYGSSSGLSATSPIADQFWSQHSTDVNDDAEENDTFGLSLK